jgi:hypothetical protein
MRMQLPPLIAGEQPNTFALRGWKVFAPGFHKGRLYTGDDCQLTVRNFGLLSQGDSPALRVKAKFGHDAKQRIAESLGVMNAGLVTSCTLAADNSLLLDVESIPATLMIPDAETGEPVAFDLRAAFEAGNICDGSVELVWDTYPDPRDPTRMLDGPVLEAVAFLGEERPGVGGLPAVGRSVAESRESRRETNFSQHAPSPARRRRVVFSEVDPMPTRDELLQKLQEMGVDTSTLSDMSDEALMALCKTMSSDSFGAAMKKRYSADTTPPAKTDDPMAQLAAFTSSCEKRFAALEQSAKATQDALEPARMAAQFAADFQSAAAAQKETQARETVERAVTEGRLMRAIQEVVLADLLKLPNGRKDVFAAGHAQAGRTPFQAECDALLARPVSYHFAETDPPPTAGELDDFDRRALSRSPQGRKVLTTQDQQ